jgi:hypothetical protein
MEKISGDIDYNAYDWNKFFIRKINGNTYLCRYGREQKLKTHTIFEDTPNRQVYIKQYYEENKEAFKKAQHAYYWKNREKILQKRRDKTKKLFDLNKKLK